MAISRGLARACLLETLVSIFLEGIASQSADQRGVINPPTCYLAAARDRSTGRMIDGGVASIDQAVRRAVKPPFSKLLKFDKTPK